MPGSQEPGINLNEMRRRHYRLPGLIAGQSPFNTKQNLCRTGKLNTEKRFRR